MEIMGRGPRQIIRESPCYFHIFSKFAAYRLFKRKSPLYGSADIINVCNLHCTHCYWWLNRKENEELTVDQWKQVIENTFKKNHVFIITLVGGEPMMRPDVVDLFIREFPKRVCLVTNGTIPLKKYKDIYFYWVSIDGTQAVHDKIRGNGAYAATRKNVLEYLQKNGDGAYKDIWITMTINSQNHHTIRDVIDDWREHSNKIGFQFHTPFAKGDPLWMPFGPERTRVIDDLISLKKKYRDYIINPTKQLEIMKKNWGGQGTTPVDCPTWAILAVDHMGRQKMPCCIGSAEKKSLKPICEDCGIGCYSVLLEYGLKG